MLDFDDASHTYRIGGVRVPSVTQILQPLTDLSGIPPEVLEAKRGLGSRVHEATHYFDEDDLDEESVEPDVEPYLQAWKRFLVESGAKVLQCEQRVFDPALMVAGTLDRVLLLNGQKVLADLKTSIATPASVGAQTAAYMRLLGDPTVTHRAALRLRPDGSFRLDMLTGADDYSVFVACLTLHRWKERNAL